MPIQFSSFCKRNIETYFLEWKCYDFTKKKSLQFVHKGPINNIPALVQIMAWRLVGAKPLSEPMMVRLPTLICVTRLQWVTISHFTSHWTSCLFRLQQRNNKRVWITGCLWWVSIGNSCIPCAIRRRRDYISMLSCVSMIQAVPLWWPPVVLLQVWICHMARTQPIHNRACPNVCKRTIISGDIADVRLRSAMNMDFVRLTLTHQLIGPWEIWKWF